MVATCRDWRLYCSTLPSRPVPRTTELIRGTSMTTTSRPPAQRAPGQARRGTHPGIALAVIAGAQLMVVLDATIVNIALPHIQGALHFSTTGLSWVLNAYTLTFGGLLLLGGRAGDILGRRRVFITGILLFSLASLLGGLATSSAWLLACRALQGVGGAIASPTALVLSIFLSIETRTRQPITPLHMFRNRNRAGTYAIMLGLAAALFGMFFFLTLFVQEVLGYSPLRAGLAFLPVSAVIIVTSQVVARLLPTVGPKRVMVAGSLFATGGLAWLSRITASSGYLDGLLGPMLLFGLGMGFLFVSLTIVAVSGVSREESGAASSLLNAMQQVGGSLGLSILVTVFGTASRNEATEL